MKKTKPLTAKALHKLADQIYSPKGYLPLCKGQLQDGACPLDAKRTMHCGLGELHYYMTGKHPEKADVSEEDVVKMAVDACNLKADPVKAIEALPITEEQRDLLLEALEDNGGSKESLKALFSDIPEENDGDTAPTVEEQSLNEALSTTKAQYKARSKRVAAIFRKAAELIK